jgi:anthranilate synthase component I
MNLDQLRREYDVIPFVRRLSADTITPVSAFAALEDLAPEAFLLESVERGESVGRYSFIGVAPRRGLRIDRGGRIEGTRTELKDCDPITLLRAELAPLRVYREDELPPFFGGAVGWFGYGASAWSERLPDRHGADGNVDAELLFFDQVIAFDHVRQELSVIANVFSNDLRESSQLVTETEARLDLLVARLGSARADLLQIASEVPSLDFEPGCTRAEFEQMVCDAKEEIAAGEAYQIVLSQRWTAKFREEDALTLYRVLRSVNPSPYMFLLRTGQQTLVGSSPEMLVRVEGRMAETRPIAGTRRRGSTPAEDRALEDDLRNDVKENSEHLMLVDLGRNDTGRVSESASVEVVQYAAVERYSHVMHLVSSVRGTLRPEASALDFFLSAFPAGTVSGAPKISAMKIIDRLEPARRNAYAGAVAYFGFSGNLDSCISIRTVSLEDDEAVVQAGAGIVFDSDPAAEYEETVNKSAALRRALAMARAVLDGGSINMGDSLAESLDPESREAAGAVSLAAADPRRRS